MYIHHISFLWDEKFLSLLRIETIFIHMSGCRIFLFQKKMKKNSNMHNFNHHGSFVSVKVSTPCQGSHTLFLCESRFWQLAKVSTPCFLWVKVSTPCQGFHTLFLCESRFPHLVSMWHKVPTPCQGSHTLFLYESRFPHLVSM